jgi:hypothetical protein
MNSIQATIPTFNSHQTSYFNRSNLLKVAGLALFTYLLVMFKQDASQNLRGRIICQVVPPTIVDRQCRRIFESKDRIEKDPTDYWTSGDSLLICSNKQFNDLTPNVFCAPITQSSEFECIEDEFPNSIHDKTFCAEFIRASDEESGKA